MQSTHTESAVAAPTSAVDSERVVLGCLFIDDREGGTMFQQYGKLISPDWFFEQSNRIIFEAIKSIHSGEGIATQISVVQWIAANGLGEHCHPALVMDISRHAVSPRIEMPWHLRKVIDAYAARVFISHGARAAKGEVSDIHAEIAKLRILADDLTALTATGEKDIDDCSAHGLAERFIARAEEWATKRQRYGWPTGLAGLESMDLRIYPGQRLLIGGEPNVGKSTFTSQIVLNLARHFASTEASLRVGVISLEDGSDRWTDRAMSNLSGIPLRKIRDGMMSEIRDYPLLMQTNEMFADLPLMVREFGSMTTERLAMVSRKMAQDHCGVIVVDYLQLLRATRSMETRDRVSEAIGMIQGLAIELKVSFIVVSSLRKLDGRTPTMDDFKETGDIAYAATEIIALSESERGEGETATEITAHILKQKDGPKGQAKFWIRGQCFRIEDPSRKPDHE